jgi:exopolyphosphatase/guanosine-5'-triphosphate,3'-diphosphate pyrophosphatase
VIDVGSNSGRVKVYAREASSHLRQLGGSRAALRLVSDVDTRGALSETTMARTTEALRDFQAIATGMGAGRVVAVATAAMRDARNGPLFVERLARELGIRIEIIGGLEEARYGFTGAIWGLAVTDGLLFDVGGGSMQISRFARRQLGTSVSVPLGALRLSGMFLESDPPSAKQIRRLRDHVRRTLEKARPAKLGSDHHLVGTGGTLRNLAKIDHQARQYPISSLHGYELGLDHLAEVIERLSSTKERARDEIDGLSADRADSIIGGAVAIEELANAVGARMILVSGQGVREGIALDLLKMATDSHEAVKEASLVSLVSRFDGWRPDAAARRRDVAAALLRGLEPKAPAGLVQAVDHAARVLDIGRTFDVVNRHQHVADIFLHTELNGFTHGELVLVSAILRRTGDRHADVSPLAVAGEPLRGGAIERASIILALADAIEARCLPNRSITVDCVIGRDVTLSVAALASWLVKDLDRRFERAFGRALIVRH